MGKPRCLCDGNFISFRTEEDTAKYSHETQFSLHVKGNAVVLSVEAYVTSWKVAGSISDEIITHL
jgi:hypothetical protein